MVSAVVSGWFVALQVHSEVSVAVSTPEILTVLSGGIGAGVLVGQSALGEREDRQRAGSTGVLTERSWTTRSGPSPVVGTVVEALADVEGVDPLELDSLHAHVDPDVFSKLRACDDSRWQLRFYADGYEVRISSVGSVTVYATETPGSVTTGRS